MPPKKTVTTAAPTALAAAGVNLSAAEINMLVSIVAEMGELPEINYAAVGERVGIKLSRNARTSAKKVSAKIIEAKAAEAAADAEGPDAEEEVADEASKKKQTKKATAAKKSVEEKEVEKKVLTKKVAAKKVANKEAAGSKTPNARKVAVGARAAPKKASAGMTKKAPAKKGGKKAVTKEKEQAVEGEDTKEEQMKDVADDEPVPEAEAEVEAKAEEVPEGKSPISQVDQDLPNLPKAPEVSQLEEPKGASDPQAAPIAPVNANGPWVSTYFGFTATFPAGYAFPEDATPTEIYQAHAHEITVEDYRVWKADNQYDDDLAPSPLLAAQVEA